MGWLLCILLCLSCKEQCPLSAVQRKGWGRGSGDCVRHERQWVVVSGDAMKKEVEVTAGVVLDQME